MNRLARTFAGALFSLALFCSLGIAAPRAHAQFGGIVYDPTNFIQNTISAVSSNSLYVKEYVLDAIAWQIGQQLIQSLTGSVVNWINGRNAGGFSLFVSNLPLHLLNTGDVQALAFFQEFANSNSPFAAVILSSLRTSYLQGTTGAGFWAANRCTLDQYSPNALAFVGGDFRQGGWSAWFALTTQPENNPYSLYERTDAELAARVFGARNNQLSQLGWGQGFLSWCGADNGASQAASQDAYLNAGSGPNDPQFVTATGPTCQRSDGSAGSIQTPGSVIHDQLSKSLGTTFDRLVSSDELNEIVGALVQRMVTSVAGDGGLASLSQPVGNNRALIDQIASANSLLSDASSIKKYLDRRAGEVATYQASWQTIANYATSAQNSLTTLAACPAYSSLASIAQSTEVQPVFTKAAAATSLASSAQTTISRMRADLAAAQTPEQITAVSNELQTLEEVRPTSSDAKLAQEDASIFGGAVGSSVIVSGGTAADRMNLINVNAQNLASKCPKT